MQFDIVIVGGGMVGAAMAAALQPLNLKIALIDASPLDTQDDHRLIALNYNSICFLKNLKLWSELSLHAEPIKEIHVSHRGHFGITRLHAMEMGLPFLGQVIPAKFINQSLYASLKHITLIRPATLVSLTQDKDQVSIQVKTSKEELTLNAQTLIAADGSYSTVRTLANITALTTDYHQSALVTTTTLKRSHHQVAYERFQTEGAIAMLPLTNQHVATIWTANTEKINQLMQLTPAEFLSSLQQQFGYRLGKFTAISERYTYPLKMIQAEQKIKGRILLLGNAAHTLHPIAAQGLNLALLEVAALTDYLTLHLNQPLSLQDFAEKQQTVSTYLSHHLSWLFAYNFLPINMVRTMGLMSLDICKPFKKYFMRQILGQAHSLPKLLREQETYETQSSRC